MAQIINISKYFLGLVLVVLLFWTWDRVNANLTGMSLLNPLSGQAGSAVWLQMRSEFSLDHQTDSVRVDAEIKKWLADPERLNRILEAATPYIYYIYQQTQEKGLPAELALIPVIESEFNPNDRSSKGAVGLWQLMPETARELGVKTHYAHDERRDVAISTRAALAYFQDLGRLFHGNWLLAIAAYNSGQVKVAHATKRAGTDDFWVLRLPLETKLYVPRLLAIAEIVTHPAKYGVQLPKVEMPVKKAELPKAAFHKRVKRH